MKNILVTAALAIASPALAAAATLDFETLSFGSARTTLANSILFSDNTFSDGGFNFTSTETVFAYGPTNPNNAIPRSGSVFLNVSCGCSGASNASSAYLDLSQVSGSPFSVQSLLVAEGRTNVSFGPTNRTFAKFGSTALEILGTFASGGTISFVHQFDGIANSNPATDFENILLVGFEGLSSLRFTGLGGSNNGYSFSVDDIVVNEISPVPLPAGLPLIVGALGSFAFIRRKSPKNKVKSVG